MSAKAGDMHSIKDAVSVYIKESRVPYMITPHVHTEYEIYYSICGGRGFFIDEHYYACSPGDLFIIKKMRVHRVAVSEPDNYLRGVISIDTAMVERIRNLLCDKQALDFLDCAGQNIPVKVSLDRENHEKFIMHMKEYIRLEQSNDDIMLTSKLLEIIAFVKFMFDGKEEMTVSESMPETWSEKAVYYIERNFKKCQAADVAKALNVSENYLSRVFKSETGALLNSYIIERKIAQAKKLLYEGASVKEACAGSGFNDCSNFIRTFRKFTGFSPGRLKNTGSK